MEINSLKINQEISDIKEQLSGLLDLFYPIGSYYETSDTSFNPNTTWGGTWVEDTKGLTTVGAYEEGMNRPGNDRVYITLGQIYGEEEHTLTEGELPALSGEIGVSYGKTFFEYASGIVKRKGTNDTTISVAQEQSGPNDTGSTGFGINFGDSLPHNNVQPSIGVCRWHRTA